VCSSRCTTLSIHAVNDTIKWLHMLQEGLKEEYEENQKELESIANPHHAKTLRCWWYTPGAEGRFPGGGFPGGAGVAPSSFSGASEDGPSVEEVD
jgi:L1 cell adhesion molecule like protein